MSPAPILVLAALASPFPRSGDDLEALARKLKDPREGQRREAVQELAKLAAPAAWSLVVDALEDAAPSVADEAQVQLGGVADAGVLKELYGRRGLGSGDDWRQLRVAEALGRAKIPVDAGALGRLLSDKSAEVRRTAAWSLERLAHSGFLDGKARRFAQSALEDARRKDKDEGVRAAAALAEQAVGSLPPGDLSLECMDDRSSAVKCAAMQILAGKDPVAAARVFESWKTWPDLPVRRELAGILARAADRRAVASLADMLGGETDLRLAWTIVDHLERLSGRPGRIDAGAWSKWIATLPDDWRADPAPRTTGAAREYGSGTAVFLGMPVLSSRLAILVDFSGSLWAKRADGKTRKEVLDVEVRKTLEGLPPESRLNLVPYTGAPIPWEKQLVPATPVNVRRALEFFEGCKATGKGNFWDAALLALADPDVDTILVFTDGAPTGGRRWNLGLMRELFAEQNRFRHVVLDAVLVDARKALAVHWKGMCEDSGGRMLAVDLR